MQESLDVVIPSYRLDEEILSKIFLLPKPEGFDIKFYLIADNPSVRVSKAFEKLIESLGVIFIVNKVNLGFSRTRNLGIDEGNGNWILLLDDDIVPEPNLLIAFANKILQHPDCIGFGGVTKFPPPFNSATESLVLNGIVAKPLLALYVNEQPVPPTADVILNRKRLGHRRFVPELVNGGEDIEFLFRNSVENNQKYISVPDAIVTHPWWDNGKVQTKRMFKYGLGISDIIHLPHIRGYSYSDFFSTSETTLTIVLVYVASLAINASNIAWWWVFSIVLSAEFFTNTIRSVFLAKRFSLPLIWFMLWHKNCYEAGYLWGVLSSGKFGYFAKRLDVSFNKINPSPFRLNKWKIIKLSFIVIACVITYVTTKSS
ncbi:glycosyltransferase [Desertivirga xinjiangensis]|uniref:glycosyltransferase n=1 Tax=Desertivirga xinjiangensis TaxID=539206 RepID=UPI002109D34C|nr:glycosyltransferase [Pedobacter xinjiangensis]